MAVGIKSLSFIQKRKLAYRSSLFAGCLVLLTFLACPGTIVAANSIGTRILSSSEIVEKAKNLDGHSVTYEGEIIGDIMKRGDYVWINVSDDISALGVWTLAESLPPLAEAGNYRQKGARVQIAGTFNRACLEHGGDYDIHASQVVLIAPGYLVVRQLNLYLAFAAIILFAMATTVLTLFQRQRISKTRSLRH